MDRSLAQRLIDSVQRVEAAITADRTDAIAVWRFRHAPDALQALSRHGGDEDWVALVPASVWEREGGWIGWAESGTRFGCCDVSEHDLADGSVVLIGAHA